MATKKQIHSELIQWAEFFPEFTLWGKNFLIRRNEVIISGLCLEPNRSGKYYRIMFFTHNLLVPFPSISLSYSDHLQSVSGGIKAIKFGSNITDFSKEAERLRQQTKISNKYTYKQYRKNIINAVNDEYRSVYLPHAFQDIVTVTSFFDKNLDHVSALKEAAKYLESRTDYNIRPIGSVDKWLNETISLIEGNQESIVRENTISLKLDDIKIDSMPYASVKNYWQIHKKGFFKF